MSVGPKLAHDLAMDTNNADNLTIAEFLGLFGRPPDDSRWMASADSEEYLALVTYLVARSVAHDRN